jgi:phage/plasmid-like protein (TIGR03299 family)
MTMSAETLEWLNANTLIGMTDKRGNAWHYREGTNNHFPGAIPAERVLSLIDIPLAEATISAQILDETGVQSFAIDDRKAIVRRDTGDVFGIFKQGYQIHGYDEWLRQNLELILDDGLQISSAVLLKKGAVASVQAELEDTRTAAEGVAFRPFITSASSCDGSLATTYLLGSQVVVCDNTLSIALASADSRVKIRHSVNSLNRVGQVRKNLGLAVEEAGDAFEAEVQRLTSEYVSDQRWNEFVKAYTGVETANEGRGKTMAEGKVGILNRLWTFDERVAPWKNNAYGVLAAVNTAVHHEFSIKGMERAERNMLRSVTGEWDTIDANTLSLLATV